ncbi:MAG TPA: glycoside hydrolase family 43 protein [Marisediminicola sp.]|nr:glycoside hydrolase family 43 protein [Marisediminicola sp.]
MRRGGGLIALLAVSVLAGCSATPDEEPYTAESAEVRPEAAIDRNFPDPDVLRVGDTYYAYATNDNARNVQVASSADLRSWQVLEKDAFPELPKWVIPGKTWAPEVAEVSPGSFVLYFTATNFQPALQCIGVATASDPAGPFVAQGEGMIVCPEDEGGAIDASTFADDDGLHLVWKNDGNCCGLDTWISTAPLSADGLTLAGPEQKLIMQDLHWEGNLVEAPTIVKRDSTYVLLYSANNYGDDRYAVGYASAPALGGPWTKNEEPLLSTESSGGKFLGPGGQDIASRDDGEFLVFHGWDPQFTYRGMYVTPVEWDQAMPKPVL